jgi:hypothetical protein
MTEAAKGAKSWEGTAFLLDGAVKVLNSTVSILSGIFGMLVERVGLAAKAIYLLTQGEFKKAWETIGQGGSVFQLAIDKFKELQTIWGAGQKPLVDFTEYLQLTEDILFTIGNMKLTLPPPPTKSFADAMNDLKLKTREVNNEFIGLAPGFVEAAKGLGLIKDGGDKFTAAMVAGNAQMTQLNTAMATLKAATLTQEFITPWQARLELENSTCY